MPDRPYDSPFDWFDAWFAEATQKVSSDPNAMTLATVSADGRPSNRVVLLKDWDERGFVFYTNHQSHKGLDLLATGVAALNFFWRDLGRQIRIEGTVEPVEDSISDAYFASRPRGSQVGAWASQQSRPMSSRDELIARTAEVEAQYDGEEIPRPPHWGGFRLCPDLIEFWQAGEFRLHDRWQWRRSDNDQWSVQRLFP